MDYYKDSLEPLSLRRPSHHRERDDYYDHRDRYDFDRDIGSYRDPFLPSDDHYRMMPRPPYPPPPLPSHDKEKVDGACTMFGSVALELINPFDPKPRRRLKPDPCHTVFVGSLPDNCVESHLTDLFSNCGSISEVRVSRGRNFGHVQFTLDSSVERAMELSGCNIRIDNSHTRKDMSKIHVDYAQDKQEVDLRRRIQENEIFPFTSGNITMISNDLHRDDAFIYAAKNVMNWLGKGSVDEDSLAKLYGLLSAVNTHSRDVNKNMEIKDEEELEFKVKKKLVLQKLLSDCEVMIEVFDTAPSAKTWNYFTKGQRKSIFQWKEQTMELKDRLKSKLDEDDRDIDEPPFKIRKFQNSGSDGKNMEADLERAMKEIEQLKTDREVSIEKKDKQIMQLKTLLAKFKKTCPEEWEKALGVSSDDKDTKEDPIKEEANGTSMTTSGNEGGEVIDGVSLADLNTVIDKKASENSLASAAAAYAKIKKNVGSTEMAGLGLSEAEVAIVSVLGAFLTVHPLGATIDSITAYFQNFNSDYNSYYLESLLCRLTKVFQRSGEGGGKWWFLGFQTCYTAPSGVKMEDSE